MAASSRLVVTIAKPARDEPYSDLLLCALVASGKIEDARRNEPSAYWGYSVVAVSSSVRTQETPWVCALLLTTKF